MNIDKISPGKNPPKDINVIIEIPEGSNIKYEVDKDSGAVIVDRFVAMPMFYPANYGFIPQTLADDGDPTDVLVVSPQAIQPGAVIRCRPIGVLTMEDESGLDEKIIAVPHSKVTTIYDDVKKIEDLPKLLIEQINKFFETYKDLEPGKWVKIKGFEDLNIAEQKIEKHIKQYK